MELDPVTVNLILVALLAISEALASIPQVKANSLFQVIYQILKKVKG